MIVTRKLFNPQKQACLPCLPSMYFLPTHPQFPIIPTTQHAQPTHILSNLISTCENSFMSSGVLSSLFDFNTFLRVGNSLSVFTWKCLQIWAQLNHCFSQNWVFFSFSKCYLQYFASSLYLYYFGLQLQIWGFIKRAYISSLIQYLLTTNTLPMPKVPSLIKVCELKHASLSKHLWIFKPMLSFTSQNIIK